MSALQAPASPDLIEVATGIGRRLVDEAIWHDGRCNWIGGQVVPGPFGQLVEHQGALNPTLYEGTAGIGLFMSELYAAVGGDEVKQTSLGAVRQALDVSRAAATGRELYSGRTGIALVAARAGRTLSAPELVDAARETTGELAGPTGESEELDLLNGTSGVLLGLLALARLLDEPDLVGAAIRLGDDLLELAEEDEHGISWPSRTMATQANLTGLSHGAAGIALALLELYDATGERRFARAAERAFDYEQGRFDRGMRNWPDFRDLDPQRPAPGPGFAVFWCHGGPGIALSRLTAFERLEGSRRWRAEAAAGLDLTHDSVMRGLQHGAGNFSLCHGIAGNAEILAEGARVLGGRWARGSDLAEQAAGAGVEWSAARGGWPCGAGQRETPGLMLGLAGIGYFYLRMAGVAAPSVLRPRPAELAA